MTGDSSGHRAPAPDELEISLFGPGLGETLALHVGNGEWIVVDSCLNEYGEPVCLEYLRALGVDVGTQVVRVVATHWHDDHVGGLARVVEACEGATFACSGALRPAEFLTLVEALKERSMTRRSGVSEFAAIIAVLKARKSVGERFPSPSFAIQDRRLWGRTDKSLPGALYSLSPSDAAINLAQRALSSALPVAGSPKTAVAAPAPNHASVVLWLHVGEVTALLGADLEETARPDTGWTVILDDAYVPGPRASVFKIPHHGSVTAHQARVWDDLVAEDPQTALTPFIQGRVSLPSPADSQRICQQTPNAFITSLERRKKRPRDRRIERMVKDAGVKIVEADPPTGHVRLRSPATSAAWQVQLSGPAAPLCGAAPLGEEPRRTRRRRRRRAR